MIGFRIFSGGIFLFLGYSSKDEALLNNYTNLAVTDAIKPFQQYLRRYIDNQVSRFMLVRWPFLQFVYYIQYLCTCMMKVIRKFRWVRINACDAAQFGGQPKNRSLGRMLMTAVRIRSTGISCCQITCAPHSYALTRRWKSTFSPASTHNFPCCHLSRISNATKPTNRPFN